MAASKKGDSKGEADPRRSELIDAAASLFAERGFESTTMRDIAAHVGKTPGTIYYHFKSKDELLVAVHQRAEEWGARIFLDAQTADMDPWQRLERAAVSHLRALLEKPDYAAVVGGGLPPENSMVRRQLVKIRDDWEDLFRQLIDDLPLESEDEKKYFRLALLGALNYSRVWYRPHRDSPSTIARNILALLRYRLAD